MERLDNTVQPLVAFNKDGNLIYEFIDHDSFLGIFLEGRLKNSKDTVNLLNCYVPYKYREAFWHQISDSVLLREDNPIVGGDLNFTLSARKVWENLA